MTNHPKTLKEALEMFDDYYPDRISVGGSLTGSYAREHMKEFLTTIWHAGRESVVGDIGAKLLAKHFPPMYHRNLY